MNDPSSPERLKSEANLAPSSSQTLTKEHPNPHPRTEIHRRKSKDGEPMEEHQVHIENEPSEPRNTPPPKKILEKIDEVPDGGSACLENDSGRG